MSSKALICGECSGNAAQFSNIEQLKEHYRNLHPSLETCRCGHCRKRFLFKNSLYRHIKDIHRELIGNDDVREGTSTSSFCPDRGHPTNIEGASSFDDDEGDIVSNESAVLEEEHMETDDVADRCMDLNMAAAMITLELRVTSSLTGKAIERFQAGCLKLLENYRMNFVSQVSCLLREKGMDDEEINNFITRIDKIGDPFKNLKTTEAQLNFFSTHFGLVKPEPKFLDTRLDKKLDPQTNCYVQSEVIETFQYVSIIQSLEALLSVKKNRQAFLKKYASEDGVIRSYEDGFNYKNHPFLQRFHHVLQIILFYDELETTNALGSKCIIHKLGVFFFQVLNAAAHLNSKLSSIHLLALVYADDMKKDGAFDKVLLPFVMEMKRLSSDAGVEIKLNGEPFVLRAALVAVTADTLAAHDLLGFLSPSAKHFCRVCMISRAEFKENVNSIGELRQPESHDLQVQHVKDNPRLSSAYGVKTGCALNKIPYFHCSTGSVFDVFHDILEGIAPLVLKCVLRHFIIKKNYMTIDQLNAKLASFDYGIPDIKNKPSPNFVRDMLTDSRKKLKQTGVQFWCLVRVLPFIFGELVPDGDEYMELIGLLLSIMQIVFSFEIRPDDIDRLEGLILRHNLSYEKLFIHGISREAEQGTNDAENDAQDEDDPQELEQSSDEEQEEGERQRPKKKPFKVGMINKMHHWKHYPEMIRLFGPPVRMWCAKFEATMKIFRQFSYIMNCFKNVPKTMAQIFQLKDCAHANFAEEEDDGSYFEYGKGQENLINEDQHPTLFRGLELTCPQSVIKTDRVTVNGEEYRPGLFLCVCASNSEFSLICNIFIVDNERIYLHAKPWKVITFSEKYHAYLVAPDPLSEYKFLKFVDLTYFNAIAPWTEGSGAIYLSLRTIVV